MLCLASGHGSAEEKPGKPKPGDKGKAEAAKPEPPKKSEAELRLEEADNLAANGKVAAAMPIWEEVLPALPDDQKPRVHLALGLACKKYGKLPLAWHHLTAHARLAARPDEAGEKARGQVEKALGRSYARVKIAARPVGARIHLGEKAEGPGHPAPLVWWFKPGPHKLALTLKGHETSVVEIKAGLPGSEKLESFQLFADEREGELHIKGPEVGANVFLDGKERGTIPLVVKIKPGTYELMISRPGRPVWKREVTVPPGGKVTKRPRLPRMLGDKSKGGSLLPAVTDSHKATGNQSATQVAVEARAAMEGPVSWWKWSLVGGGGTMILVGGILQIVGYQRNEDLREAYPDGTLGTKVPAQYPVLYKQGYDNDVKPMATTAYVLYGLGAAAAVTGGLLLVLEDAPARGVAAAKWVTPALLPGGAGVSCGFEF